MGTAAEARTSSSMPDTVRQLTYCDSCSKRAIADGLNPLTIGHMPSNNSHKNSGMIAMACHTESADDPEQDGDTRNDDQRTAD